MPFEIVPFEETMLPDAGRLLAFRHQQHRTVRPELPARFEDPETARAAVEEREAQIVAAVGRAAAAGQAALVAEGVALRGEAQRDEKGDGRDDDDFWGRGFHKQWVKQVLGSTSGELEFEMGHVIRKIAGSSSGFRPDRRRARVPSAADMTADQRG